jgi:Spy/CpxP family protein refolding chaperone
MSFNRKFLWSLGLLLAASFVPSGGFAAPPQGGNANLEERRPPEQQVQRMAKMLDLTADQQTKLKPILVDERKKMNAVRSDTTLDRSTMRDKMTKIRQDTNNQVRALLNDQQKGKFDKIIQAREERMQNRGDASADQGGNDSGGGAPEPPPQK